MAIKVLYVEDELFLGKIVKESLETRGFDVRMEADGTNVLKLFNEYQPDVCVLDVMLPNKNGFEIAREIREIDKTAPIVFLTAKSQTEDVVKGFTVGGNDYIRKPFSLEELIVRLENVLRNKDKKESEEHETIHLGKFTFYVNRLSLVYGTEEKKLTFRESELLKLLYRNRNSIIDRRDILNVIWGNDSFFNSRNLDVYITKLRTYLKDELRIEIITIKGVGYRFVVEN
ncbi:response regulator transcription factor [Segetibacter aerophilus]|uniref:Transcriptional regulatory protein RprY n=1 Tax=Segetibacter aerophilus TaxID=670293 RepID=A0A512BAQ3_9BACT|nr:response regulator transcription factor [Segetibacter aerophilus]GEO09041.1 transcriptional regulatory protein RprY [Segetibacter aerophilus]